jgi:CheY-like chemotaxis protein
MQEASEDEYDMILMDIQMPVMNGYEACRQIRRLVNPKKASIPILAMTADAFEEDRQRAIEAGMNGHLTKPIQIRALYDMLEKILAEE